MIRKNISVTVKAVDGEGKGTAVFATLNVMDKDGDVTLPGAFGMQNAKLVGAHDWSVPNIGKAAIREDGNQALADFAFYLDMNSATEWYKSLKNNFDAGLNQEWSYGFDISSYRYGDFQGQRARYLEKMIVHEVSPVMIGAGVNTTTRAIKSAEKQALPAHETPTTDAAWDGPANEANVKTDQDAAYYEKVYAWRDPAGDPAKKTSYRFIHHEVSADGEPGAANLKACVSAIAVLNGGRGIDTSSQAWSGDRKGIHAHLAKHIKDAGDEPPALKGSGEEPGLSLAEDFALADWALSDVKAFGKREQALAALRSKEGRTLSRANRDRLTGMMQTLADTRSALEALLIETDNPTGGADDGKAANLNQLFGEYLKARSSVARHLGV